MKLRQPVEQDVVVIIAARIPGDRSARLFPAVVHADDDRRCRTLERKPRIAALCGSPGHVRHLTGVSALEPRVECIRPSVPDPAW